MGRKAQNHSVALRIQALALFEEGVPVERVKEITGMSRSAIFRLRQTARSRGYDPNVSRELKEEYVQDAPRSGRPRKDAERKQGELPETTDASAAGAVGAVGADVAVAVATDPATVEAAAAAAAAVAVEDALKSAVAVMDTNPINPTTDSHVNGFLSAA